MQKHEAGWWILSEEPEAKNWRRDADGGAFSAMIGAVVDHYGQPGKERKNIFGIPPPTIENPPLQSGKFFAVPHDPDKLPVHRGRYFSIPGKSGEPVYTPPPVARPAPPKPPPTKPPARPPTPPAPPARPAQPAARRPMHINETIAPRQPRARISGEFHEWVGDAERRGDYCDG